MARGGKREGSGRKVGAATRRTREIANRASALGITPLEVMLDNMRHFQQVALDAEAVLGGLTVEEFTGKLADKNLSPQDQFKLLLAQVKQAAGFRQMAQTCATNAAPFIHASLKSVEVTGKDGGPVQVNISGDMAGLL